jgi:hypothetical protein
MAGGRFFQWVPQPLSIKVFYGASDHTVKTPIWIAVSVYVLVASSANAWWCTSAFAKFYRF